MGFTKSQEKVINYGKGTLLVEAGPGSPGHLTSCPHLGQTLVP